MPSWAAENASAVTGGTPRTGAAALANEPEELSASSGESHAVDAQINGIYLPGAYLGYLAYGRALVLKATPQRTDYWFEFATHGGLSRALFRFVTAFMGHYRGGTAIAAIGACGSFGAICGSSLATAATMGQVALPELRRAGYSGALATGALAAGGTLGIMIPPSIPLVIYGILTEESIGKLFMAAVVPGVIAMIRVYRIFC